MKRLSILLVVAFVAVALAIPATAGAEDGRAIVATNALECDGIQYDANNPDHILVPDPSGNQGFIQNGTVALVVLSGPNQVVFTDYTAWGPLGQYPLWTGAVKVVGTVFADIACTGPNDPAAGAYPAGVWPGDQLIGKGGDDRFFGEGGVDQMLGGAGDDYLVAGNDDDIALSIDWGAAGPADDDGGDDLRGGNGDDTLMGNDYPDKLKGGAGNDVIVGGPDTDNIFGQAGDDTLYGLGDDFETFVGGVAVALDDAFRVDTVTPIAGFVGNNILGGNGDDMIFAGDAGETLKIKGGPGDDTITGGVGADRLQGNAGDDVITGGTGGDVIVGGGGDDWIDGGEGADNIFGRAGNDELYAGVENTGALTFLSDKDNVFGGDGDDILVANGDAADLDVTLVFASPFLSGDILDGEAGDDLLYGDEGDDILGLGFGEDNAWGWLGNDIFNDIADLFADNMWGEAGDDQYLGNEFDPELTPPAFVINKGTCDPLYPSTATEVIGEGADTFTDMLFYSVFETGTDTLGGACGV